MKRTTLTAIQRLMMLETASTMQISDSELEQVSKVIMTATPNRITRDLAEIVGAQIAEQITQ